MLQVGLVRGLDATLRDSCETPCATSFSVLIVGLSEGCSSRQMMERTLVRARFEPTVLGPAAEFCSAVIRFQEFSSSFHGSPPLARSGVNLSSEQTNVNRRAIGLLAHPRVGSVTGHMK